MYLYIICIYIIIYICNLWCFYHRWIVVIGLYIIYIYTMLSGHPHIFIFYVIIVYIICYPGHPHMFTYVYIYYLIGSPTHTHTYTYIYFKPHNASTQPSQQQQPAAAAAAGCCYTFEEMEEMQASANVPIRDIYIYIRFII